MRRRLAGVDPENFTTFIATILNACTLLAYTIGCYPCLAAGHIGDSHSEPITVEDGIVLVDVTINGRGPFRMVVDTGTASCILKPEVAQKAGLVYNHRSILGTLKGDTVVPAASNNLVQVGDRSEPHVDVVVTGIPQFRALRSKAEGVLGQSFLSRTPYLIDYRRKRIWLGAAATQEAERLPVTMAAGGDSERVVVPVALEPGGREWRLTLDSGATQMVVECRENCPQTGRTGSWERLITYTGEQPVSRCRFRSVRVGGVGMPTMDALIANVAPPDGQDEGVLPMRWFSAVYVDNVRVKLAVVR
jgi:predicted aspartyl protease